MKSEPGDFKLYRRLIRYAKPKLPLFFVALFGFVVYATTSALQAELVRQMIIALEEMGDSLVVIAWTHPIVWIPLSVIGLFIMRGVGTFLSTYYMDVVSRFVIHRLRTDIFKSFQKLPIAYFNAHQSGSLVNRINYNVEQVAAASSNVISNVFREGLTVVITLMYMAYLEWKLTLVMLVITPVIVLVVSITSGFFRKYSRRIQNSMGEVTQVAAENIRGQNTIRIFGGKLREVARFDQISANNMKQALKLTLTRAVSTPVIQLFLSIELAAVIWTAFWLKVSPENLIGFFTAAVAISKPMRSVTQINQDLQRGLAAAEDIFVQLDAPDEVDEGELLVDNCRGDLSFEQVSFRYDPSQPLVLEDINLHVEAGQTVALVGRSGGGKTSLVSLLPRFYNPTTGRILLDGVALGDLQLSSLRANIALVSQQPVLFEGSIKDNIAYGRSDASVSDILLAAEKAHVMEFAAQMPLGLDTEIGVDGSMLSGGQKQRVAIARAILKDAPILILDEATSALDNESERLIQDALDKIKRGRTTLVIAHRLSTIESSDLILVMEDGRIVEKGTHQQLLASAGIYSQLHSAQFKEEA
jgi:subfamily B ATP-binding cassette protein MsbA